AMKSVWRQARRPSADDLGEQADASQAQDEGEEELRRKQREMAVETALAVDTEISRWKNGIAELDAMSAEEASDDSDGDFDDHEGEEQIHNERQHVNANIDGNRQPPQNLLQQEPLPPPVIRFPNLPSEVLDDEEYDSSDA
ncbi:MAG: hypothetical protein SGARI_008129, partial [Bacillariaceae sp.]